MSISYGFFHLTFLKLPVLAAAPDIIIPIFSWKFHPPLSPHPPIILTEAFLTFYFYNTYCFSRKSLPTPPCKPSVFHCSLYFTIFNNSHIPFPVRYLVGLFKSPLFPYFYIIFFYYFFFPFPVLAAAPDKFLTPRFLAFTPIYYIFTGISITPTLLNAHLFLHTLPF